MNYQDITKEPIKNYLDCLEAITWQGKQELIRQIKLLNSTQLLDFLDGSPEPILINREINRNYNDQRIMLLDSIKKNLMVFLEKNKQVIKTDNLLIFLKEKEDNYLLCLVEKKIPEPLNPLGLMLIMDNKYNLLEITNLVLQISIYAEKIVIDFKNLEKQNNDYFSCLADLKDKNKIIESLDHVANFDRLLGKSSKWVGYKSEIEKLLIENKINTAEKNKHLKI